jgi:hypothetical protein
MSLFLKELVVQELTVSRISVVAMKAKKCLAKVQMFGFGPFQDPASFTFV